MTLINQISIIISKGDYMAKLKYRTKLGDAVDNKLYKAFVELHNETDIQRSKLLDEALELLLKKYNKEIDK